jgi:hypothetical protein
MCQIRHLLSSSPISQSPLTNCVVVVALFTICGALEKSHSIPILILSRFIHLCGLSSYPFFLSRGPFQVEDEVDSQPLTHFKLLPPISDLALIAFMSSQTNTHSFNLFHIVVIFSSCPLACIQTVKRIIRFLSNTLTIYISQLTSLSSSRNAQKKNGALKQMHKLPHYLMLEQY